jgi:hypothetical protein
MIDEVHFLDRSNERFLQVADACAFGCADISPAMTHPHAEDAAFKKGIKCGKTGVSVNSISFQKLQRF